MSKSTLNKIEKKVKGVDKIPSPPIYYSEYDLDDEDIKECISLLGLEEVLYQIGFSKECSFGEDGSFYEVMECEHRTRSGKIVKGKRYSGRERLDFEWMEKGMPSEEARLAYRGDISYMKELRNLSRRSCS